MTKINDYFDKIYCLNLDRRPDRLQSMKKRFDHFGIEFTRIKAFDALQMTDPEFKKFKRYKSISKKELCCTLGHSAIYRDALHNGYSRVLVFEDDAMFVENFSKRIQQIEELDWNLVLLGSSNYKKIPSVSNGFYHPVHDWGAFAYGINKECFEQLLEWNETEGYDVADHLTIRYFERQREKCFVFFPNICIADVSDSDMRPAQSQSKISKLVKWNLIAEKII